MHHIKVMRVIAIAARSNLAIFSLLFLFLLLLDLTTVTKTTERHVVGFLNFAWPLNIINKNSEEKNIFLTRKLSILEDHLEIRHNEVESSLVAGNSEN